MRMIHIVRKSEHVNALKRMGAKYVVRVENTQSESLQLASYIDELNTRVGFDAIGSDMPAYLLRHMENVFLQRQQTTYGSGVKKHFVVYGKLDNLLSCCHARLACTYLYPLGYFVHTFSKKVKKGRKK